MNTKNSILFSRVAVVAVIFAAAAAPSFAFAARTVTAVQLNGAATVSVAPGTAVTAAVTVKTTKSAGQLSDDWQSTGWRIATTTGAFACVNTTKNISAGTYTANVSIKAPAGAGIYNAYFIAYSGLNCKSESIAAGPSATFTLASGVVVAAATSTPPPPPALFITPLTLPSGTTTVAYSTTLTASTTATGTFSWSVASGALPTGLTLGTSTGKTVAISGTPTASGTVAFAIKATNGTSSSTQNYALLINAAPVTPTSTPTSTTENLILNPDLTAAAVANTPDHWSQDSWGTNTAVFAYPVAGPNGTDKAEQITMSNYASGDADWSFDGVPVTANGIYTFSDWYKSNVSTEIDVAWNMKDGTTNYEYVTALGPTNGWASTTQQISIPLNVVSVTVFHLIQGNGTLATAHYSLAPLTLTPTNTFAQGMVSLSFDDGYLDHYTNAFPILHAANMGGTFYMIPNVTLVATSGYYGPNYMSIAQMLEMQAAGNDMASHAADHCDLVALYNDPNSALDGGASSGVQGDPGIGCPDHALAQPTTAQQEINNSKTELAAMGATPDNNMAYPFGSYNTTIEQLVKAGGFLAARGIDAGYNTRTTNPYDLLVQDLDPTTTVAQVEAWIDTAAAQKLWLVLVFHQIDDQATINANGEIYAETPQTLQAIVSYLQSKASTIKVVTVGQGALMLDANSGVNTPPPPTPTSTLSVNIAVNGGIATSSAFNLTVKDGASTVFAGAGTDSRSFIYNVGDSYSVTEATTSASSEYSIALGAGCSGTIGASGATCAITNTFTPPAVGANLIQNPSVALATANSTTPDHWNRGGWGTNTATLTYPAAGPNGAKAINVTISSYTNGDAKWYFDNVPVTAGKTYTFSDSYNSTVTSVLTAQYTAAGGALSYADLATLASTGGAWATSTAQFTVPSGVTAVTIFHLINAVGSLTTTNASLVQQ